MSKLLLLGVIGFCAGFLVAGGLFTVLLSVGLLPRFAGKTHTGNRVFLYEEMVVFGAIFGILCSVFPGSEAFGAWMMQITGREIWRLLSRGFLLLYGVFAGMFVGALAITIAEMLDSIPIFARRIQFRKGIGIVVLAIAIGKLCGSLYYFAGDWDPNF